MQCEKCGVFNVPEELKRLTNRNKCLRCTIKGYKFMMFKLQKDIDGLNQKVKELEAENTKTIIVRRKEK